MAVNEIDTLLLAILGLDFILNECSAQVELLFLFLADRVAFYALRGNLGPNYWFVLFFLGIMVEVLRVDGTACV